MSKYIGSSAVNLSTTSADVTGNADIDGNLTVGGNLTVSGTTITVDHASAQTVDLGDGDKIRLGADYELQLWSDGTTGQISGDFNHTGSITTDGLTVDGTLGVTGVVTANAGVVVDNITIDGTTLALSSGDLTLDVAGDIILDADGGDIKLHDGGVLFGKFTQYQTDFYIDVSTTDRDMFFRGIDSGVQFTALTLDMSAAGAATFNAGISTGGNVVVGGTLSANSLTIDDITINSSTISDAGNLTIDSGGDINLDSDAGNVMFLDGGLEIGLLANTSNSFTLMSRQSDKDIIFKGIDGGAGFTALTLDMSNAGFASFNNGITLKNDLYINNADGSATAGYLYNDSDDFVVRSWTSDKDIIFKGNDGGSVITALTLDMSALGKATFNHAVVSNAGAAQTAFFSTVAGAYIQVTGSSSTAMGFGMTGGNGSPATAASTSFGFHHWNNSSWANPVNITREGIAFNGDTAAANTLDDYEEGTYVPTISTGSGTVTLAGGYNTLSYIKVGGKVTIQGRVRIGSTSSPSGTITMTIPFQNKTNTEDSDYANLSLLLYGVDYPTGTIPFAEIAGGNSFSTFLVQSDNAAWATFSAAGLSANDIIYVTGTYFTAA